MAEHGAVPDREVLLGYYREIAQLMRPTSPGAAERVSVHGRYCFFQRNATHPQTSESFEEPIHKVPILQKNGSTGDYLFIDGVDGLLACVEADAVEFHAWGSRVPDYERPDRIAFDLDPSEA